MFTEVNSAHIFSRSYFQGPIPPCLLLAVCESICMFILAGFVRTLDCARVCSRTCCRRRTTRGTYERRFNVFTSDECRNTKQYI